MGHLQMLTANGYAPYLVCSDDSEAADVVAHTGVAHLPVALSVDISLFADIAALLRLVWLMIRHKPAVVHGHMSKAGFASLLAARMCRVPARVYHNHGMACFSSSGRRKRLLEWIEKSTCRLATHIIFCSHSTRSEAIALGICEAEKSCVIGGGTISGIDCDHFSPANAASRSAQLAELDDLPAKNSGQKCVIFVGRIVPHKGIDTLLEAWSLLPQATRNNATLIVAGANDGDALFDRLESLVNCDASVRYLGRIDNIVGLYGLADILVLPSWHEGFPYSVLEAQACGVPAIVTRVTGNIDAVVDQKTGLLVECKNAQALADAMEALLNNADKLRFMGAEASDRIIEHYQQPDVLAALLRFYEKEFE